jgi:hypothetical protein
MNSASGKTYNRASLPLQEFFTDKLERDRQREIETEMKRKTGKLLNRKGGKR